MTVSDEYRRFAVLLVDDEAHALKYFERAFRDDFRILTASSAAAALQLARGLDDEIGVLITDHRMPGQTGVDLLSQFQGLYPDTVRILTTAYGNLDSAIAAVNQGGVFRYVTKPWNLDDLRGTILRAMELFLLKKDHERLVSEKLSVLQRMVVLDRLRGLSVLAAALDGVMHRSLAAFMAYVEQAPLGKRIQLELEKSEDLDLISLARSEAANLIDAVREIRLEACDGVDLPFEPVDVAQLVRGVVDDMESELQSLGVTLRAELAQGLPSLSANPRLLRRLFGVLIRRLSDMDGEDRTITVVLRRGDSGPASLAAAVTVSTPPWNNGQLASLYSALMPIQRWPIGLDMDTFACFLIAFHHRGRLEIHDQPPLGPGFQIELNPQLSTMASEIVPDSAWFDRVFSQVEIWGRPL